MPYLTNLCAARRPLQHTSTDWVKGELMLFTSGYIPKQSVLEQEEVSGDVAGVTEAQFLRQHSLHSHSKASLETTAASR